VNNGALNRELFLEPSFLRGDGPRLREGEPFLKELRGEDYENDHSLPALNL